MSETVLVAAIASVPATITAGAAWMAAARGRKSAAIRADKASAAAVDAATKAANTAALAATKAAEAAAAAAAGRDKTEALEARFMGNGHGDVVHMLETLIERQDLHDLRHAAEDGAFKELAALVIRPAAVLKPAVAKKTTRTRKPAPLA